MEDGHKASDKEGLINRDRQVKRMDTCDWCGLSEEDRRFQVSELTDDEWDKLRELVCRVEACLKAVLGAALCNWSCLMNDFYKEAAPDPHLHIHVRPRYDKPVTLNGRAYPDSEFGHHYAPDKSGAIPAEDKEEVFIRLKEWLDR